MAILNAFKELPEYNFLWKFEDTEFPVDLPPNVIIRKWLPQTDILNHTNTKLFATHGGSLSTFEATWFGVPTVGFPFFSDQHTVSSTHQSAHNCSVQFIRFYIAKQNVHRSVHAGVSECVHFPTFTTADLKAKLLKVLTDPNYSRRMKLRSQRLRDQPEKPIDRAVWWVEYLMRNPDASHLRPPTVQLGFIKANCLDWYAILFVVLFGIIYSIGWILLRLRSLAFRPARKLKNN